eukprot:TRINITY_DN1850_c0_g2_i2.p1 TRINITY_DN1850_c0_g2~~TRINITY_DN1850_c0_g2_i2.p1  ORF type:complete len:888 (+),score=343.29 TRINITY_DN1850_c0_g2_i2:49-2712(+)
MRSVIFLGLAAVASAVSYDAHGCVQGSFDSATDYFPYKTNAVGGEKWAIEYHGWYKSLTVSYTEGGVAKERVYQLVQCFSDANTNSNALKVAPSCVAPACNRVQIPVRSVGVASNTLILGMFEALNILNTITYVSDSVTSPCLQSLATTPADPTSATQVAAVDAYFVDTIPTTDSPKFVKVSIADEVTPSFRANWVEFVALFYNLEHEANYIGETVQLVYDAQAHHVKEVSTAKTIGWIKAFTADTVEFTDSLYIKYLIQAADATPAAFAETMTITNSSYLDSLRAMDVLIVEDNVKLSLSEWLAKLGVPEGSSGFNFLSGSELNLYQVRKYTSPDKLSNDFDEYASMAPDLILSDLIKIAHNVAPWTGVDTVFLRRYTDSLTSISPSADACGKGIYRPFNTEGIRAKVLSELRTVASNPLTPVEDYKPFTDYFPVKVDPTHVTDYAVSYHLTWKVVRNLRIKEDYILLLKGCPETSFPSSYVLPGAKRFKIPVDTFASSSTVDTMYILLLSQIGKVKKASHMPTACILRGLKDGFITELSWPIPADAYTGMDLATAFSTDKRSNFVTSTASADEGPLNRAEWLLFFSTFFNNEDLGHEVFNGIKERYMCVKQKGEAAAQVLGRRPSVVMMSDSYFGGKYAANAYPVWVMAVETAGGVMAAVTEGNSAKVNGRAVSGGTQIVYDDDEQLHAALADVDVFIDNNYFPGSVPSSPVGIDEALAKYNLTTDDTQFKFIANKAFFRVDKRMDAGGFIDWFGRGVTDADAVEADLINMIHPGYMGTDEQLYFGRNLMKNEGVFEVTAEQCTNYYARLPPLTASSNSCQIPCSERLTHEYCTLGCLWENNKCKEIPMTPVPTQRPVIVYVGGSAGVVVPSVMAAVLAVFAALL